MIREIHTISEATYEWVRGMNAFPYGMIKKLVHDNIDDWHEVTTPSSCDRVYMCSFPELDVEGKEYDSGENYGIIQNYNEEKEIYTIELDNGAIIECAEGDFEVERDSFCQCGELYGILTMVVMIIGSKMKKESVKCQNVGLEYITMMNGVTFSELMARDMTFMNSIGFLCIKQGVYNGTIQRRREALKGRF